MRRAGPILIVVIGFISLLVGFVAIPLPALGSNSAARTLETKLGLDLRGGLRIEYQVLPDQGKIPTQADLSVLRQVIVNRIDKSGVAEPQVVVQGNDRIIVEMPGVTNADQIRQLVGTTGRLDFIPLGSTPASQDQVLPESYINTNCPTDGTTPVDCVLFSGDQVAAASIGANQTGQRTVDFTLKGDAKDLFANYTTDHVGDYFAVVLDGKVITAPVINSAIPNGQVQISRAGSAATRSPTPRTWSPSSSSGSSRTRSQELASTQVSATLGDAFLRQALLAGLIAVLVVVTFMVVHYRMPGVIASGALMYYALVVYALFRLIPVTLTLAGVAGFVLSVGMAVDANILIFERTKEELRLGKSLPAAIEAGFNRAWNSILDSNVSSLITASILFLFGSSTIRGFGLVLIIGVLVSMFTAVTVTRTCCGSWSPSRGRGRPRCTASPRRSSWPARRPAAAPCEARRAGVFDIIGKRNWFFAFSLLVTIPGLIFILLGPITGGKVGLQFAIDFTGGTVWTIRFEDENVTPHQVKSVVDAQGFEANVTKTGDGFIEIRTKEAALAAPRRRRPRPSRRVRPGRVRSPAGLRRRRPRPPALIARRRRQRQPAPGSHALSPSPAPARAVAAASAPPPRRPRARPRPRRPRPRRRHPAVTPASSARSALALEARSAPSRSSRAVVGRRRRLERPHHPGPDADPVRVDRDPALDHLPVPRLQDGRHRAGRAAA